RLAGWAIADHMRTELVIDALAAAGRTRGSLAGAVMHTDHGSQYTSRAFAEACRSAGVRQSMSAVGSSADNAAAESFNATLKRETLQGRKGWSTEREARLDAFCWLTRYNTRRRHSRLGQRSPIAFENTLQPTSTTLAQAA
ncbi:integrase core domain-containing protein, partial [Streptomyces cahuitamycinicus]